MLDRRLVAGGAAIAILAVVMTLAFVLFSPRWAVGALDQMAGQLLGRSVSSTGGAHLDVSPLSIRIDGVALSGPERADDAFITAGSMVIPVSFGELLRRRPDLSELRLENGEIALLINERGEANWDFPGVTSQAASRITLAQGRIRYFDVRNGQSLELDNVNGILDLRADGGASFTGTAVINSRLVRIDADLKSLARVNEDGSPLELAIAADSSSASFSGRLSTAKVLNLAGPVSLSSSTPVPSLRMLGLPLPESTAIPGSVAVDGVLDTAGRAYAIRNATVTLGAFRAVGDVVADLRGERPKLQANLAADNLWLDSFVPASGARDGDWGRTPLPFDLLRNFDAEIGIDARSMAYGAVTASASRLQATLTQGKLTATVAARFSNGGTLSFTAQADATALPPAVALDIKADGAEAQPLFATLIGASQITGTGAFAADVTASGKTQEELAGTLKGTASLSLADGRISGTDLAGLFIAARQKILDGWTAAPGGTAFTSFTGQAAIGDGIASFRGVTLQTAQASFTVDGLVDVLRQGVELSATAMSSAGQPLLPVPVIARGPWAKPRIYPDVPNILTNPEGGFARLQDVPSLEGN